MEYVFFFWERNYPGMKEEKGTLKKASLIKDIKKRRISFLSRYNQVCFKYNARKMRDFEVVLIFAFFVFSARYLLTKELFGSLVGPCIQQISSFVKKSIQICYDNGSIAVSEVSWMWAVKIECTVYRYQYVMIVYYLARRWPKFIFRHEEYFRVSRFESRMDSFSWLHSICP